MNLRKKMSMEGTPNQVDLVKEYLIHRGTEQKQRIKAQDQGGQRRRRILKQRFRVFLSHVGYSSSIS